MFDKLKHWTMGFLDCLPNNEMESCSDFNYYTRDTDPRELPRPKKYPSLEFPSASPCTPSDGCSCYNCRELIELSECPICTGDYQRGVTACEHCGNVTCWGCAARLPDCPFCRRPRTAARNTALERIFSKLQVPCKPSRLQNKKLDTHQEEHMCLVKRDCTWRGMLADLASHLEGDHSVSVLVANGITIEIAGFRSKVKMSELRGRQYTISLACFASIFVCNISLHKKRLRLLFTGASSHRSQKFGACLEVESSYRVMKGIMPVSSQCYKHKELYISCSSLLSPWRQTDDVVKITITIRPIS
ncbi:E3 ubiquitin-protein ligase sina-like [Cimex lectularius]|uniref:RING-type domain-containing protein n=1 Tax=Cimex lectularius TaxID=79782 RepID=A0A8I6RR04_CIMLE|nr:E3 ubiquitin-protein ligase sina-like [Cimex lectularius]